MRHLALEGVCITVRTARDADQVGRFLQLRHPRPAARRGELLDPLDYPALLARERSTLAGVLTYLPGIVDCEILTLHVTDQWQGVGTALITELVRRVPAGWAEFTGHHHHQRQPRRAALLPAPWLRAGRTAGLRR